MAWFLALVVLVVAIVLGVLFLNRFYAKSTRETALVRTGLGGRRVLIDGGALSLPILHRIERINMRTTRLRIERQGAASLISEDRLRVDVAMEFHVRVDPSEAGVATAAQAFGSKTFREEEMQGLIEGKLVDAIQSAVASRSMDELHEKRDAFVEAVSARLAPNLARSGLMLDSVSLVRLDQTPFNALDENNAFNAVGMRKLAELVSHNKKARVQVETEADVEIRRRLLDQTRHRLQIEREQEEAELAKRLDIERRRIDLDTEIQNARTTAERLAEEARIAKAGEVKRAEIDRDLSLRKQEIEALLAVETAKIDNSIRIAAKRGEEQIAEAGFEAAKTELVKAQEAVQTERDVLAAERGRQLALLKAREDAEVDDQKVKSQVDTILSLAKAESNAAQVKAEAERHRLIAESEGRAAMIEAENAQSEQILRLRLEMHKLDMLPDITAQMMKPVEKIDSIRINHISGLGPVGGGSGEGGGGGGQGGFQSALDSIMGMAIGFPMIKKLGEEIGVEMDHNLGARALDAINRSPVRKKD
ncbi:flotillin family protein [Aquibium microcysteis]|uniref:flotillin family protein n=1 Tax=Aquibium microcysteis TaxID=675281 RepID=UPI00165D22EC|nr:flotillin domain-containing protein [Aquibium microcysteis]